MKKSGKDKRICAIAKRGFCRMGFIVEERGWFKSGYGPASVDSFYC